jgi:phosphoribosylformimino-5-aminoimidazole carboxamide ribonucleotide (ProFAR) isomerase
VGELNVLDQTGDLKTMWNKENPDEVEAARKQFEELKAKKFLSFDVDKDGSKGKMIKEFNPHAEKLIMTPPLGGG